jgi:site-specific DNA-methyltransferase (adenine-specific)
VTILEAVRKVLTPGATMHLREIYESLPDTLEHSIRARIYENLGKHFRRVGPGLYIATVGDAACVVVGGDAWEEVAKLPSNSIDALVTDPPYPWINDYLAQGTTRKTAGRWSFATREIDATLGLEIWRVLKDGAHVFFFAPAWTGRTRRRIDGFVSLMERCGLRFNKAWVWDKGRIGWGHHGRARHETILFLSKGTPRTACDRTIPDVLAVRSVHHSKRIHETEKPVGLMERLIQFATRRKETVLDCFAGSCPTGVAALGLGRNAILIERSLSPQEATV